MRVAFLFKLFVITGLLSACYTENKPQRTKPEDLFSLEQMADIMTDIQLAEAIISHNRSIRVNNNKIYKDSLYRRIFDQHGVTKETFESNVVYYNGDPKQMEDIYELIQTNLMKKQSEIELEAMQKQEEMKKDSLMGNDTIAE